MLVNERNDQIKMKLKQVEKAKKDLEKGQTQLKEAEEVVDTRSKVFYFFLFFCLF